MNAQVPVAGLEKPISIAILAMGGQGGGVLTDWIVAVAEANGWHAQSTSVPGVAQRTGATIYYIEMLPPRRGKAPVLALMPTPGDVDIVIASEMMEAGRSILRGLATPEKTLLITSTHRTFAVAEKEKPGEAIADPQVVNAAAGIATRRIISFDMDDMAKRHGTVISAPILGALAGSKALPFSRESFENVVRAGGKGVTASLQGFAEGFSGASLNELPAARIQQTVRAESLPQTLGSPQLDTLLVRLRSLPESAHPLALAGLKRAIDFQDARYGAEYVERLEGLAKRDHSRDHAFTKACAKHVANAMCYDDVIGVADLKIRTQRFERIEAEMKAAGDPIYFTEFMHPRAEEIVSLFPARLGRRVVTNPRLMRWIDHLVNRGRHVNTAKFWGFLQLYLVAGLRRFRRSLLRHENEMAHLEQWLTRALQFSENNPGLAVGIINARRLIKGYSDTHARGLSKFDRLLSAVPLLAVRDDAGAWMERLISAALKDENGDALDGTLRTIRDMQ